MKPFHSTSRAGALSALALAAFLVLPDAAHSHSFHDQSEHCPVPTELFNTLIAAERDARDPALHALDMMPRSRDAALMMTRISAACWRWPSGPKIWTPCNTRLITAPMRP